MPNVLICRGKNNYIAKKNEQGQSILEIGFIDVLEPFKIKE